MKKDANIPFRNLTVAQADAIEYLRQAGIARDLICRHVETLDVSAAEFADYLTRNPRPAR